MYSRVFKYYFCVVLQPTLYKPNPDCPRGKATCLCKDGACEAGLQCVVSGGGINTQHTIDVTFNFLFFRSNEQTRFVCRRRRVPQVNRAANVPMQARVTHLRSVRRICAQFQSNLVLKVCVFFCSLLHFYFILTISIVIKAMCRANATTMARVPTKRRWNAISDERCACSN